MITNSILIDPTSIRAMYDTVATAIKECQLADEEYVTFRLETSTYQQAQEIEKVIASSVPGVTTSFYYVEIPISDADKLNIRTDFPDIPDEDISSIPSKLNVYFIKVSWTNRKNTTTTQKNTLN